MMVMVTDGVPGEAARGPSAQTACPGVVVVSHSEGTVSATKFAGGVSSMVSELALFGPLFVTVAVSVTVFVPPSDAVAGAVTPIDRSVTGSTVTLAPPLAAVPFSAARTVPL